MVAATAAFAAMSGVIVLAGGGIGWLWAALTAWMAARALPLLVRFRHGLWLRTGTA